MSIAVQDEAYRTAREYLLREVIRYAHSRKVQVSLSPAEMAELDIWEAAVRSMIESYPEADRYWAVSGSELLGGDRPVHAIPAKDPQIQTFIRDYEHLRPLLPQRSQAAIDQGLPDLDLADIGAADKPIRRIKARYPEAKLGLALIFRGGQFRALDAVLPKDVTLMNMVNFTGETAMSYFDGIEERDLVVWPRITDDGCELKIQLNAMMYDHDEVIPGGVRHGLTGILGQLNKAQGAEQSAQYIAQGAWNADIRCEPFYQRCVRRLYGPDVLQPMLKAFLLLEENEQTLGWRGRRGLMSTSSASSRMGSRTRRVAYRDENLKLDRQALEKAIRSAEGERQFWDGRAAHCGQALVLLRQARPKVRLGWLAESDYVIYKTGNFINVFELLSAALETSVELSQEARCLLMLSSLGVGRRILVCGCFCTTLFLAS